MGEQIATDFHLSFGLFYFMATQRLITVYFCPVHIPIQVNLRRTFCLRRREEEVENK